MCGTWFDGATLCDTCPLNGSCRTACCPGCGYGVVDGATSTVVRGFRALRRRRAGDGATLETAPEGRPVTVAAVDPSVRTRVAAYGIEPGREVTVLQRSPLAVVRVDEVEVAIERSLARLIALERAR
jgi:Fe2+ transport system protein FeoA